MCLTHTSDAKPSQVLPLEAAGVGGLSGQLKLHGSGRKAVPAICAAAAEAAWECRHSSGDVGTFLSTTVHCDVFGRCFQLTDTRWRMRTCPQCSAVGGALHVGLTRDVRRAHARSQMTCS